MIERVRFAGTLPYYPQIATRELAWEIFEKGSDPELDPNWAASGAESPQEYAYWVMRACGIACVKMCVEGFGGEKITQMAWIKRGLAINGYLIVDENGEKMERGWIHSKLAALMQQNGLQASAAPASLAEIINYLHLGYLVIASVSYELGTHYPVMVKGGHLVVVRGADLENGAPQVIYINNPSGRTLALQENAAIPVDRFLQAYTGRVVLARRK